MLKSVVKNLPRALPAVVSILRPLKVLSFYYLTNSITCVNNHFNGLIQNYVTDIKMAAVVWGGS